jgi:hypothetical protein
MATEIADPGPPKWTRDCGVLRFDYHVYGRERQQSLVVYGSAR